MVLSYRSYEQDAEPDRFMNAKLCLAAAFYTGLVVPVCPLVNKEDTAPSVCMCECEGVKRRISATSPHCAKPEDSDDFSFTQKGTYQKLERWLKQTKQEDQASPIQCWSVWTGRERRCWMDAGEPRAAPWVCCALLLGAQHERQMQSI